MAMAWLSLIAVSLCLSFVLGQIGLVWEVTVLDSGRGTPVQQVRLGGHALPLASLVPSLSLLDQG